MPMRGPRDPKELEDRRCEIRAELASVRDLRPGSLVARYRKCGKPSCHCANEEDGGHGPSWSLTRSVGGKTVTRVIPASAVVQTQEQIVECRRLRHLTRELIEVSIEICEAKLVAPKAAGEAAKKGAERGA